MSVVFLHQGISKSLGVLLLGLALGLTSCETSFDPYTESDRHFTVLGFLDTDADTQFVRVVPLRGSVERPVVSASIDASVRSFDTSTGQYTTWQDSVIVYPDSTYGHVFWTPFRAQPENTYSLEVSRSDGYVASASTTVPPRPGDPDLVYGAEYETGLYAPLWWPGVSDVIDTDVTYMVNEFSCNSMGPMPPPETAIPVFRRYEGALRGRLGANGDWLIELQLKDDREFVNDVLGITSSSSCVVLYALLVRIAVPDAAWTPPGGIWDRDVLAQPGTFSNIENGFGFWGAVARTSVDWQLSLRALNDLVYDVYVLPGEPAH